MRNMKKSFLATILVIFVSFLSYIQPSQAKADEPKTFIGTIESFKPTFARPPKWPMARFTVVADNGEKIEVYVLQKDTTVTDVDGKSIENKRPQVGKKVEIKYSTGEHEIYGGQRYEAISIRYVPTDYKGQTTPVVLVAPERALQETTAQPKNILIGNVKKSGLVFGSPPLWEYGRMKVATEKGEEIDVFLPSLVNMTDIKGKPMNRTVPDKGQRVEVKYSIAANGHYEADLVHIVPADYVPQSAAPSKPVAVSGAPGNAVKDNIFVGTVDTTFSFPPMGYFWKFVAVADNGEKKEFCIRKEGATIIQIDGKSRYGEAPRKGRRIEVKYSVVQDGNNVTTSMRYVPLDYVQQQTEPITPTQTASTAATNKADIFTGTVESFPCGVGHFKSGPPLWPVGMIVVIGNNGEKNNFLIVRDGTNATTFYDADGKISSFMNNIKAVIGKKVEVKYAITEQSTHYLNKMLAISVRYLN